MRRLIVVLAASLLFACGDKTKPVLSTGNNDDSNSNTSSNNLSSHCITDADCNGRKCSFGQCVDAPNSTPNGRTNNVSPNNATTNAATNNATNNTNNGTLAPAVVCDDTGGANRFTLWENTGISVPFQADGDLQDASGAITGGIAVADFDRDGDVDVLVSNQDGEVALFSNGGSGTFTNTTAAAGITGLTQTTGLAVADFDGDGDQDFIAGRTTGGAYVLENQGDGTFIDATAVWGVGENTDVISSAAFGDFDGDGDLDLYVGNYTAVPDVRPDALPNRLYRNDGTTFAEVATSPGGAGEEGVTLAVAWWDFDGDGRLDLWSVNDFGMTKHPNQLWRNVGPDPADPDNWLFEDISAQSGTDVAVFGMSATLGDFDNDGDRDGYVANMANNVLHVFQNGTTSDEASARGVAAGLLPDPMPRPLMPPLYFAFIPEFQPFLDAYTDPTSGMYTLTSWASIFFDADHDGWQDLYVSNGAVITPVTPEATNQPNYLYLNQADGTFDRDPCYAIPDVRGSSRGAAIGDLDGDGDMDLLWADIGVNGVGQVVVARNEIANGNWLTVGLRGQAPNTDAIGAKVVLQAAGMTQTRWIDGGQSFLSVSERVAHFGLGAATGVDSLQIVWPDGSTQSVTVTAINERLVVQQ